MKKSYAEELKKSRREEVKKTKADIIGTIYASMEIQDMIYEDFIEKNKELIETEEKCYNLVEELAEKAGCDPVELHSVCMDLAALYEKIGFKSGFDVATKIFKQLP